jgi:hypothetical protein
MESLPNRSTFLPVPGVGAPEDLARVTQRGAALNSISAAPRIATLWRETVATFVAQSGPVLVSAWFGFATTVAAIQCFRSLSGRTPDSDPWLFLVGAVLALLLHTLALGALAWIGLHGNSRSSASSLANAWRVATAAWRGILPGMLVHAALTFVCALSLTPILISSGLMETNLGPIEPNQDGLPRLAATRGFDAAVLGVLHPFGEWVAPARIALRPMFVQTEWPDPETWLAYAMKNHMNPTDYHQLQSYGAPMAALPAGLIALAGLALLVAGELLLRFNAAAAVRMAPRAVPVLTGVFGPLLESARLGIRHARLVLFNAVTLRLLIHALQIIGLILTTSTAETAVLPRLASLTGAPWVVPVGTLACIVGSAAVSAFLTAFCALYDVRLYVALARM